MEKYGFVYIWYDRKHKRYYIGAHWGSESDGYICSSPWMRKAYSRRPEDFKRRILERVYTDRKQTFIAEEKYLDLIKKEEFGKKYYNLRNIKGHWSTSDEKVKTLREKISETAKKNAADPVYRAKYLEGLKARDTKSSDPATREKRRQSMMGKNKGKITAKDSSGNVFHTTKDDPRWITGEIWAASKGVKRAPLTEEHKAKVRETSYFKTLNNKKVSCVHCGAFGNPGNIGRYHNDRCRKIS